ncbi:lipopolysaccharide ABC transporter substrate-binding protein LptC, partial [Klebsiella pneumoniae]
MSKTRRWVIILLSLLALILIGLNLANTDDTPHPKVNPIRPN